MSALPISTDLKPTKRGRQALTVSIAILLGLYLALLISRVAVSVPFQDELHFSHIYASVASDKFIAIHDLIAAHDGHPYLILKLLMMLTLSNGLPWTWLMYAQVPILMITFMITVKLLDNSGWSYWVAMLAIALAIITPRQWENLYWGMQIAFSLSLLLGLSAFYCLQRYAENRYSSWLFGALAIGLLASVTAAQGFLAFLITLLGLITVRPSRKHFMALFLCGLGGIALFVASEILAVHAGTGKHMPEAISFGRHVARMFANAIAYYGRHIEIGVLVGASVAALAACCSWIALKRYRQFMFELACIAWGVGLILVVSYARLSAGINQPDAPRYVPLVMPILIGNILVLARTRKHVVLAGIMAVVLLGYFQSALSEWRITPYRKANLSVLLHHVCSAEPGYEQLSSSNLHDIQQLFCPVTDAK